MPTSCISDASIIQLLDRVAPHAGVLYWVTHAHGLLLIMSNRADGPNYSVSVAPGPVLALDVDDKGADAWRPLIEHGGAVIEDMDVREKFIVLFTREGGLPAVRWATLASLGIHDSVLQV